MAFKNASKKKYSSEVMEPFVNANTGEVFQSELPNVKSVNVVDPNFCIVDSVEYVVIDDNAMRYLRKLLPPTDVAKIYQMTEMCKGIYNALHKDEVTPHTKETLKTDLGIANTTFYQLMSRLEKAGVIGYLTTWKERRKYKHILLNPTIARRGKRFHADCRRLFEDLGSK